MGRTLSRTAAFTALWRQLRASRHGGPRLSTRLAALPRMIGATLRRRYDGLWRLSLMALALLYVVWPIDFVPELLLGPIGLLDDLVVVTWLAGSVLSETSRFLAWEQQRRAAIPGQWAPASGTGVPGTVTPAQAGPPVPPAAPPARRR